MPFETLKHRFVELAEDAFWDGQEAENEFKVKCDPLKHRFFDFTQDAFWVGKEEENEFLVIGDHLNRLHQIAFSVSTEAENKLRMHSRPWNIAFSTSSKSHFALVDRTKISWECNAGIWNIAFSTTPKSHFGLVKGPKMSSKNMLPLETSLFRPHPSCILGWSRGKKWDSSAWWPLETSISDLTKLNFGAVKMEKITFKFHSTTWIVALSTWINSHFRLVKKQKTTSKWH